LIEIQTASEETREDISECVFWIRAYVESEVWRCEMGMKAGGFELQGTEEEGVYSLSCACIGGVEGEGKGAVEDVGE
jgi:hypothetical protein